jgi:hypothetical protein
LTKIGAYKGREINAPTSKHGIRRQGSSLLAFRDGPSIKDPSEEFSDPVVSTRLTSIVFSVRFAVRIQAGFEVSPTHASVRVPWSRPVRRTLRVVGNLATEHGQFNMVQLFESFLLGNSASIAIGPDSIDNGSAAFFAQPTESDHDDSLLSLLRTGAELPGPTAPCSQQYRNGSLECGRHGEDETQFLMCIHWFKPDSALAAAGHIDRTCELHDPTG